MNDRKRIDFLASLFANCPTAKVAYKPGDEDEPYFTISVPNVCAPACVRERTFRQAVDAMKRKTEARDDAE